MDSKVTTDVRKCARCGGDHRQSEFAALQRPVDTGGDHTYTHWAPCPTNGEPILLRVTPR